MGNRNNAGGKWAFLGCWSYCWYLLFSPLIFSREAKYLDAQWGAAPLLEP
jgi:hypothetical protein